MVKEDNDEFIGDNEDEEFVDDDTFIEVTDMFCEDCDYFMKHNIYRYNNIAGNKKFKCLNCGKITYGKIT